MVRQFDVCPNPDPETRDAHPYLVVLQSDALKYIDTRVVAPLVGPKKIQFFERLLPEVTLNGSRYVVAVPDLAALSTTQLTSPVGNLEEYRDRLIGAIDLVFTGV